MASKSLSWKARRKGNRYCAPACGRGCTWDEYQAAVASAKDLVKRMKIGRWRINVFENLGWHWSIRNAAGHLEIWGEPGAYRVSISEEPNGGGTPMHLSVPTSFKDPNTAARVQVAHLTKFTNNYSYLTKKMREAINA